MAGQADFGTGGEHDEVLETYKMFAYDEGWSRRINEAIDSGLTAEAAIEPAEIPEAPEEEFGRAIWVKEIRTTSHNNNEVKLRNLVSDDPDDDEVRGS